MNNRPPYEKVDNPMLPDISRELRAEAQQNLVDIVNSIRTLARRGYFIIGQNNLRRPPHIILGQEFYREQPRRQLFLHTGRPLFGERLEEYVRAMRDSYARFVITNQGWAEIRYEILRSHTRFLEEFANTNPIVQTENVRQQTRASNSGAGAGANDPEPEVNPQQPPQNNPPPPVEDREPEDIEQNIADRFSFLGMGGSLGPEL